MYSAGCGKLMLITDLSSWFSLVNFGPIGRMVFHAPQHMILLYPLISWP